MQRTRGPNLCGFLVGRPLRAAASPNDRHDFLAHALRNLHARQLDFCIMDRTLIALGLVLLSVPLLFSLTRGLIEAVLIAPFLGALAYYVLLSDWE